MDAIIIGGGIAGLSSAYTLLQLGMTVTILERNFCGEEASWAGGGILSPLPPWDYSDPVTQLTQLSNRLFPKFIEALKGEAGVDPEYRTSGMLVLTDSSGEPKDENEDARYRTAGAWCAHHAFPMRQVRSHDVAPILACDEPALWLPKVCQVRNPRLLRALRKAIELSGGNIIEHTEVTRLKIEQGHVQSISTGHGDEYTAANYIVTAGAWSSKLLHEYALKLDIWPVRGQILLFKAQPDLLPAIVLQGRDNFYLIPRQDGHILAGSTLENAGFDKHPTFGARKMLLAKARALMPALTDEILTGHWTGLRPGSPGNIPVIDSHPAITNLYVNCGHYRYGVTMAPGSAHLLSNMILKKAQPFDVTAYRWPV
jgi:glycine oxidase